MQRDKRKFLRNSLKFYHILVHSPNHKVECHIFAWGTFPQILHTAQRHMILICSTCGNQNILCLFFKNPSLKPLKLLAQGRVFRSKEIFFIPGIWHLCPIKIVVHNDIRRIIEKIQIVNVKKRRCVFDRLHVFGGDKIAVQYHQFRLILF